ncbi:MAG: protein translocase subunit SecD [Oligoflexus sp.]|nr:protein translocase subunit SecD [Oligoflexus sp.]
MKSLRVRLSLVLLLTLGALYYLSPTFIYFSLPKDQRNDQTVLDKAIPKWLPQKHIKLGLDLQGGVQLVLGVDTEVAIDNKLSRLGTEISRSLNEPKKQVAEAYAVKGQQILRMVLEDGVDETALREAVRKDHPELERSGGSGKTIDWKFQEGQVKRIRDSSLQQAEIVVRSRIDKWGVSEPAINRRADRSIMVQLPGFKDPERARELLGRTAQLKFKLLDEDFKGFNALAGKLPAGAVIEPRGNAGATAISGEDKAALVEATKGLIPEGRELLFEETKIANGVKTRYTGMVVKASTELAGEDVSDANVTYDPNSLDNKPVVSMKFSPTGGKRFADITGGNIGKRMAIVLDDVIVSDPVIQARIAGGSAQISMGNKNRGEIESEAQSLALVLRSGALPAPITVLEERQVGASLGPELADQGVESVLVGLVFVLLFILWYYKRPGLLSCVALILNAIFLLALMASFGFSLSLPGFAGFILTLGMAVDANVLINERILDELAEGRPPLKALENGFGRVFWTIIDSNVTTLIAAFVLLETSSSGPVKGFAISLILGLVVSLFTALSVTRWLFGWVISRSKSDAEVKAWLGWSNVEKAAKASRRRFDFLKYGNMVSGIGFALILAVVVMASTKGFNWAVDFAGGTEMEVQYVKPIEGIVLRDAIKKSGVEDPQIQAVGEDSKHYLIRFEGSNLAGGAENKASEKTNSIRDSLAKATADYGPDIQRVEYVGPAIGKELRTQGMLSLLWAIIGIALYVALRFDMRFTPGALLKMAQDMFAVLAFYLFFQRSFDLTTVACLLTIVGYSVNDVVVIYDRIRENLALHPARNLRDNINIALNETFSRSINTSVASMVSLFGIFFFGSSQILNFALAMVVGIISATITSTFLATSAVLWSDKFQKNRAAAATPSRTLAK